jgi:hypothetical protein
MAAASDPVRWPKEMGAIVDATLSALNHVAPWRRGVGWKVVLVEGIVALAADECARGRRGVRRHP